MDSMTGGQLRQTLEQTLAELATLKDENHTLKVTTVLKEKGWGDLLSADDLKGIPADKVDTEGQKVYEAKRTEQEAILRKALESHGMDEDDITAFFEGAKSSEKSDPDEEALRRLRDLKGTEGKAPG